MAILKIAFDITMIVIAGSIAIATLFGIGISIIHIFLKWLPKSQNVSLKNEDLSLDKPQKEANLGKFFLKLARYPELFISEKARYQHMQIIGASGTGKTRDAILPYIQQDISHQAGVAVIDVKSNLAPKVAAFAEAAQRQTDFLRFELSDPQKSLKYNPLVGDDPSEIANRVFTALYQSDRTPTPFYRDLAFDFLRSFFGLCHVLGVVPTLRQLRDIAADQIQLEIFCNKAPRSSQSKNIRLRYCSLTRSKYMEYFQGLVNKLTPFSDGPISELVNTTDPEVLLEKIIGDGKIVVFGLAADIYPADYKVLSTLILMDIQSSFTLRYHSKEHSGFFLYLDEVADLVYPEFRALVAKAREANVGMVLAHQAQGDLRAISSAFMDSIMSSTSNKVIFRLGTADSAEQFSNLIGSETVYEKRSIYQNVDIKEPEVSERSFSFQPIERFIIPPLELINLEIGEAVMIIQSDEGRVIERVRTWDFDDRKAIYDATPSETVLFRRPTSESFLPLVLEIPKEKGEVVNHDEDEERKNEILGLVSGKIPIKHLSDSKKFSKIKKTKKKCVFRLNVATDSDARWPVIPIDCGQAFRRNVATFTAS